MVTFTGFLGNGTGTGSFTEQTGTGYARQAISLTNVSSNMTTNVASATFTASGSDWGTVTQWALYSAVSGGSPLIWWNKEIPVAVANTASLTIAANYFELFFNQLFYQAGAVAMWGIGDIIGTDVANANLTVGYPLSASNGVIRSNAQLPGFGTRLGYIIGANMNVTTDQQFTSVGWGKGKYIIEKIVATNASISLTTAAGGIYPSASKAGTAIVAAGQAYTALTASTLWTALTLSATGADTVYTSMPYFSLTTGQGAAATADLHIFGQAIG